MRKYFNLVAVCSVLLIFQSDIMSQQVLFINEVMAGNKNGIQDDALENDDWLEVYYQSGQNPAVVNLAGYYFSDNPNNLTKWEIPSTNGGLTTIVSGQHLLFWVDKDPEQGEDHVDFKFSTEGETVFLVDPDGTTIIDSIEFPQQVSDISYGRECDGCDDWVFFNNATPDDENMEEEQAPELLFINEVLASNSNNVQDSDDENEGWIEIYNPNSYQVNLSDYYISNTSNELLYEFPNTNPVLSVVPPESFLLLWCDNELSEGENHVPFVLDQAGGDLTLVAPDETTSTDTYNYPSASADVSWGRQNDGSPNSIAFNIPTPRVTNSLVIVEPEELYINELLADNFTDIEDNFLELEDWIEIYNPNNYDVDLAGYYMSDNPENPMKWQVPFDAPDSTTVPANGWLLFFADEDGNQGINHTSFRLNNNMEQLTLYSPDGFSIADHIEWEGEADDISLGRETDGNSNWVHFSETTPNASNNGAAIGVSELLNSTEELLVWPNPSSASQVRLSENTSIRMYDMQGKLILEQGKGEQVNIQSLESGMYLILSLDGKKCLLEIAR